MGDTDKCHHKWATLAALTGCHCLFCFSYILGKKKKKNGSVGSWLFQQSMLTYFIILKRAEKYSPKGQFFHVFVPHGHGRKLDYAKKPAITSWGQTLAQKTKSGFQEWQLLCSQPPHSFLFVLFSQTWDTLKTPKWHDANGCLWLFHSCLRWTHLGHEGLAKDKTVVMAFRNKEIIWIIWF